MSRSTKQKKTALVFKPPVQNPQVQKVVNQRYTNGKKQYKVIWSGKPFEEATWIIEENLKNCPEKINQFLKRYQQVIKRKNLLTKTSSQPTSQYSVHKIEYISKPEGKKMSLQKPENGTQQKIILSQSANLNKQKLQASMEKNNLISHKKTQNTELNKPSSSGIKINHENYTEAQIEPQTATFVNAKSQKQENDQKFHGNKSKQLSEAEINRDYSLKIKKQMDLINDDNDQDTAQSYETVPVTLEQNFINFTERLDIEKICGLLSFDLPEEDKKHKDSSKSQNKHKENHVTPDFFLVKNRFQTGQKLISRQRLIVEQPLKLIEFYENLLSDVQQQKN